MTTASQIEDGTRVKVTAVKEGWGGAYLGQFGTITGCSGEWYDVHVDGDDDTDRNTFHREELTPQ